MKEEWRTIEGTGNRYSVSNLGNVKRNEHYTIVSPSTLKPNGAKALYKEKEVKGHINLDGYKVVYLCTGDSRIIKAIHRLVAEAFIPNCKNLECVNHINENRLDNSVSNLEWCTYEYNNNFGTRKEKLRKISGIRIALYNPNGDLIKIWDSMSQAATYYGSKSTSRIRKVCKSTSGINTYKGYIWKYVDLKIIGDCNLKLLILQDKTKLALFIIETFTREELLQIINKLK